MVQAVELVFEGIFSAYLKKIIRKTQKEMLSWMDRRSLPWKGCWGFPAWKRVGLRTGVHKLIKQLSHFYSDLLLVVNLLGLFLQPLVMVLDERIILQSHFPYWKGAVLSISLQCWVWNDTYTAGLGTLSGDLQYRDRTWTKVEKQLISLV